MTAPTLLVTGASGHLGQRVLHHLLNTLKVPAGRIIATSRKPAALAQFAAQGVTVRIADFDQPQTLEAAFHGAQRLLLISTDAIIQPGLRLAQHKAALEAAGRAGVQHVVYTSMPQPEGSPVVFAPDHAATEAALAASGLPGWTVLRNHWYFENLLMSMPQALAMGKWFSAAGEGRVAHIARDDLGRAAATALARDFAGKVTLTLSGARAHTAPEIAGLVSAAVGKPLHVVPVPVEGLVQGMTSAGLPLPLAQALASLDVNTAQGRVAGVTHDYAALTGVQPQSLESWLDAHRAALAAPLAR